MATDVIEHLDDDAALRELRRVAVVVRALHGLRRLSKGGSDLALIPPWLNRVLELPLRFEAAAIERGLALPAGLSVGTVCRAA